jgi:FKBP-type peptidyl-prolyl cis-trans isomerase (trigger factor)
MHKINIKKLPKSEVEIEGEIEADIFESYFDKALEKIGTNVELPGFRKGKIPNNILLSKVPEMQILEEMAEMALSEHYPKIIEQEKIDAIGRPDIAITKIARKNPLNFKIKVAILPEIKLADYKKIAKKVLGAVKPEEKNIEVADEDLENTIMDIRKSRAPKMHIAEENQVSDTKSPVSDTLNLPDFNDEFVQALGPFKDMQDFKDKLRENIKLEKENIQKEKTRLKIIEEIIEQSTLDVPELLTKLEVDKIIYRMESDVTQMGLKFEDYLKHLKKTVEELRTEFHRDGEKKAKLSLILNEISKTENIIADQEQVAKEVAHILEHYKEADPERARMHAENVLTNEKIFQFLENQN